MSLTAGFLPGGEEEYLVRGRKYKGCCDRREGRGAVPTITLERVKQDPHVDTYLSCSDACLGAIGYTEHGYRHANLVARIAQNIMLRLGYSDREAELAAIAGYLHDIGNMVSRHGHGQTGALLAWHLLTRMGMPPEEVAVVVSAIGCHDPEDVGQPVHNVAAALILADKADVHRSRVRNPDVSSFDIHDRVNYAVKHSFLWVDDKERAITLQLEIDTEISPVMDYFEIFLTRMIMCRRAASFLGCDFGLSINDVKLL